MVFVPCSIGRIGLCHLHHEQSAQQMIILLQHLHANSPLGQTLEILVCTYQLWAGMPHPVLTRTDPYTWIPDHWLTNIRAAMHEYKIQIQYKTWTIKPLQFHDRFLIEDFVQQGFSKLHLEQLNTCRMYLNIMTLAEITDHTGAELLSQILSNLTNPTPKGLINISTSTLQWPWIHNPSAQCWHLWMRTLCTIYVGSPKNT